MTPEEVVLAFFRAWEEEGLVAGYERYIHPDILYQNTGLPDRTDKELILESIRNYVARSRTPFVRVEMKAFMSSGNTVVAERIDHMFSREGAEGHSLPVVGTFIIEDEMIRIYRDYFDPREVLAVHARDAA